MARKDVDVLDGLGHFFGGIGFVLLTPSAWPYAAVPATVALVLGCGLSVAGFWGSYEAGRAWLGDGGGWATAGHWAVAVSLGLVLMIASVFLALSLAQPFSGWALDALSLRQEAALTGRSRPEPSLWHSLWVSVRCTAAVLAVGTATVGTLTVVGLLFPPAAVVTVPLKFLVLAWLLAWDFTDYPLGLRRMGLRARLGWVLTNFGAFTAFGMAWAAVLLVPFVALLVLPLGVAGATRMVVQSEGDVLDAEPA